MSGLDNTRERERLAFARLREGTEVLRTGGGTSLTADQCNLLLNALARAEREAERLAELLRGVADDVRLTIQDHYSGTPEDRDAALPAFARLAQVFEEDEDGTPRDPVTALAAGADTEPAA